MDFAAIELALRQSPLFQELFDVVESGDYSRFDSEAKRQHFIPQFILRRFATDPTGERVHQLDVTSGANRSVRIDEAASRRWFYAMEDAEGNRSNQIEGFLAFVEGHAAEALARLLDDPGHPTDADRGTLSFFFSLLDQRTPGATRRTASIQDGLMRMLFTSEFSNREKFVERYREIFADREAEKPATEEEIEEFRQQLLDDLHAGRVAISNPHAHALQTGITMAAQQCYLIFGMHWTLMLRDGSFITSDRGLAIHDPEPHYPWSSQALLSSEASETTIPLSSDACLLLGVAEGGYAIHEVSRERANEINLRTYGWSDTYVFGRSQQTVTSVRQIAKRQPQRVIRPKPAHQVIFLDIDPTDSSLADRNRARGWPPYIPVGGVPHDYVVFRHDQTPLDAVRLTSKKVEERARRALGVSEDELLRGGERIEPFFMDQIGSGGGLEAKIQRDWSEFKAWVETQVDDSEAAAQGSSDQQGLSDQ